MVSSMPIAIHPISANTSGSASRTIGEISARRPVWVVIQDGFKAMLIVPRMLKYILFVTVLCAQERVVKDPGVITTRQAITPAGLQSVFNGRVYGVAFGKTSSELWVLHAREITLVDWRANKVLARVPFEGAAGLGGIRYDASADRALVTI